MKVGFHAYDFFNLNWVPVTTAWRVPWVADRGVGLQIWSSSLGVWREANNVTHSKNRIRSATSHRASELD